jgi:dTDP-4-dehydrorhamnose 3,5-epimerase
MNIIKTEIPDVLIFEPKVFGDDRGFFMESFNQKTFEEAVGRKIQFVQDNHSKSKRGVLRGMHYQSHHMQGKLVRVIAGSVFDVAVDLRSKSATHGHWFGVELSAENKKQLWVPEGFAHGFFVLEDNTEFVYKCTDFYHPQFEHSLLWNDSTIGIEWPFDEGYQPIISEKDVNGSPFKPLSYF